MGRLPPEPKRPKGADKKIIEIPFDRNEEKIIIITKGIVTTQGYESILTIIEEGRDSKVILLPSSMIEEVKVIRDVGK